MPIPIPIPMPVGPLHGKPFGRGPHMEQHSAEGEVKKIYLLQPVPKMQPAPQLKGGGFVAPIQTHIHLQPTAPKHAGHFGHQTFKTSRPLHHPQQSHHNHEVGDTGVGHHSAKGDMKILPIVVIPPVAPMPPIQIQSAGLHPARMTLAPQFNNYVMSAGNERRKTAMHHSHGPAHDQSTFNDYGGSLGGSVFRDHFASRSRLRGGRNLRPMGRSRLRDDYEGAGSGRFRSRDFDYGEADYAETSGPWRPSDHFRRNRRGHRGRQINSIRDVVEQTQFDDDLVDLSDQTSYGRDELRVGGRVQSAADLSLDNLHSNSNVDITKSYPNELEDDHQQVASSRGRLESSQRTSEISLQDLPDQTRSRQQNLNSLYYDREPLADFRPSSSSRSSSSQRYVSSRQLSNDRDLMDEDEWRFDSIKSVAHLEASSNMTVANAKTKIDPTGAPTDRMTTSTEPPKN